VTSKLSGRIAADTNVLLAAYLAKRDPTDIPLAALALKLEIPVWSNDRDFEELPLIAYPTAKLLKILGL
jgi:predicted nucleic acid-binding protein